MPLFMSLTKTHFSTLITLALFVACQPPVKEQKQISVKSEASKNMYHTDSLIGHWVVIDTYAETDYENLKNEVNQQLQAVDASILYMPLAFLENGKYVQANAISLEMNHFDWSFDKDSAILLKNETALGKGLFLKLKAVDLKSNILTLEVLGNDPSSKMKLFYKVCRIHPESFGVKNLFSEDLNTWRNTSVTLKTEAEVKQHLKSLLRFNASYLKSLDASAYKALNFKHLNLPFDYYNGGMVLRPLDTSPHFAVLFKEGESTKLAYTLLQKADGVSKYPKLPKEKFVLGYAKYMEILEKAL
jgi:hypothetical protein